MRYWKALKKRMSPKNTSVFTPFNLTGSKHGVCCASYQTFKKLGAA